MAQIFPRSANTIAQVSIVGAGLGLVGLVTLLYAYAESPYQTRVEIIEDQPVPFSHEHHVNGLGIDCRYCHSSVEHSANAGLPPTHTCMSCHSQIWGDSPMLAPVRASLASGQPLRWTKIHDLGDFVYFHHGIHIQKGVGCVECHGRVDKMPLMWKDQPMTMEWCLECHRHPENRLRKPEDVIKWPPPPALPEEEGAKLVAEYHIPKDRLTNCSTCHR